MNIQINIELNNNGEIVKIESDCVSWKDGEKPEDYYDGGVRGWLIHSNEHKLIFLQEETNETEQVANLVSKDIYLKRI